MFSQQERLPANKLFNALDNSEKIWGPTTTVTLDELINNLVSNGKNPVLSGVYVYDRPENGSDFKNVQNVSPKTGLRIDALGVFKKDKLVGWLNAKESTGYNYIANNVSSTPVNVPCSGGRLTIETIRSKTKVNGKSGEGKPKFPFPSSRKEIFGDVECNIDLLKKENIKKIELEYQSSIKETIKEAIKTAQKTYQSDIFGFGQVIYRSDPRAFKRFEPRWEQEFKNVDVSVKVNAKIRSLGTITKSFQKDIRE